MLETSTVSQQSSNSERPPGPSSLLAESGSWLTLVARTTLGTAVASRIRAQVLGNLEGGSPGALRLIVQSYGAGCLDAAGLPVEGARPLGSSQWFCDAEELKAGVSVCLVQLARAGESTLVAWVEAPNGLDLDFDALEARPAKALWFGEARVVSGQHRIELRRRSH